MWHRCLPSKSVSGDCVSLQFKDGKYDTHRFVELSYPRMLSSDDGEQIS